MQCPKCRRVQYTDNAPTGKKIMVVMPDGNHLTCAYCGYTEHGTYWWDRNIQHFIKSLGAKTLTEAVEIEQQRRNRKRNIVPMTIEKMLQALKDNPGFGIEICHYPQPFGVEDKDGFEGWRISVTQPDDAEANRLPYHLHVTYEQVLGAVESCVRYIVNS